MPSEPYETEAYAAAEREANRALSLWAFVSGDVINKSLSRGVKDKTMANNN